MSVIYTIAMIALWLVGIAGVLLCAYRCYVEATSIERGSQVRQYSWMGGAGVAMFLPGILTLTDITDETGPFLAVALWTVVGAALACAGFERARRYRAIEHEIRA